MFLLSDDCFSLYAGKTKGFIFDRGLQYHCDLAKTSDEMSPIKDIVMTLWLYDEYMTMQHDWRPNDVTMVNGWGDEATEAGDSTWRLIIYLVLLGDVQLVVLLHLSELGLKTPQLDLHLLHVLQVPLGPLVQDLDGLGHVLDLHRGTGRGQIRSWMITFSAVAFLAPW